MPVDLSFRTLSIHACSDPSIPHIDSKASPVMVARFIRQSCLRSRVNPVHLCTPQRTVLWYHNKVEWFLPSWSKLYLMKKQWFKRIKWSFYKLFHLFDVLQRNPKSSFPFTLSITSLAFSDYEMVIQDRRFFGASCPRVKVGTERTTAKKRGQSPQRATTTITAIPAGVGRGRSDTGSYCTGTVSRELAHPTQSTKPYLL